MTWDLDDIFDALAGHDEAPQLIALGPALVRVRPSRATYFWSNGRIGAVAGATWVRIDRRFGPVGEGIRLHVRTLRLLSRVLADWARRRDSWAAFYSSCDGYPIGFGGHAMYYQAPGKRGERVMVGCVGSFGRNNRGAKLVGRDEIVKVARRQVDEAAKIVAEIWRRGEGFGPASGSLVGARYQLATSGLYLDARRNDARLWNKRGGDATFEAGDEAFVSALLRVVMRRHRGAG